jgi:hypothetical protein
MNWYNEFISIAGWSLRTLDLRYKMLHCDDASSILTSGGVDYTPEQMVLFTIFEACIASHLVDGEHVKCEVPYPLTESSNSKNPKRADLAFKDGGSGKGWNYIEAKKYTYNGKRFVAADIRKIRSLGKKCGRYLFLYRVTPDSGGHKCLKSVVDKNFARDLTQVRYGEFPTHNCEGMPSRCHYGLYRVKI